MEVSIDHDVSVTNAARNTAKKPRLDRGIVETMVDINPLVSREVSSRTNSDGFCRVARHGDAGLAGLMPRSRNEATRQKPRNLQE